MKKVLFFIVLIICILFIFSFKDNISFNVQNKIYKTGNITFREETGFSINNNYLLGVEEEREVSTFDLGLDTNYTTSVLDKNNNAKTSGNIATGDKVQIKLNNEVVVTPVVLIKGDVNGDGKISSLDYVKIKNHIMETNMISGELYTIVSDYNNDNKISSLDYVKMKNYIMAKSNTKYTITYNSNGGTGTMSSQEVTEKLTTNLVRNSFTKEGYTFKEWNTSSNGTGTTYKDVSKITVTNNITLYAQWQFKATITCNNKIYNGSVQTIAICNGGIISNAEQINAGNYIVQCTGSDGHEDALPVECLISKADISASSISNIEDQIYTGNAIIPNPIVTIDNDILVKDVDYTINYSNNIDIGAATLTIIGKGNYEGTNSIVFQIVEDESNAEPVEVIKLRDVNFYGVGEALAVNDSITVTPTMKPDTATNGNLTWTSSDPSVATVSSKGRVIGRKEGKVTITAVGTVMNSGSTEERITSSYDLYVCNNPIKQNGEINNDCFGIIANTNNDEVGEQNSRGLSVAVKYALDNEISNISLKEGKYYLKAVEYATNNSAQKYPTAILLANNTNSSLNLNLNNSTLELQTNNYKRGSLIYIGEVSNITISNGTLVGDKNTHICEDNSLWIENQSCAESYHGIYVHAALNTILDNLTIKDFVGDGIYIYGNSQNTDILNSTLHDFGRNSITPTSGNTINVIGNTFYNNNYGINLEPTSTQYEADQYPVKNLLIENNIMYNSKYHVSVHLFRSKNIIVRNNRISDIIFSSYCGETRDETDYNSRCFAGDEKYEVSVSNNIVYVVEGNTTTTTELVNINCIDGAKGCKNSLPWRKFSGNWYYINFENGTLLRNQWILGTGNGDKLGKWYYVNNNGYRYLDTTVNIDGEEFTFDTNGICISGSKCMS